MEKMRFGIAHRILYEAQEAERKLKGINRQLKKGQIIDGNVAVQDTNQLNSDVMEEITIHIEKLNEVLNEAGWWQRQTAKSLLIDIAKEIKKFQEILVERMASELNGAASK